jgi:hypothetical protein
LVGGDGAGFDHLSLDIKDIGEPAPTADGDGAGLSHLSVGIKDIGAHSSYHVIWFF